MSKRKQTWDNYKEKVAKKSRIDKGAAAAAGGSDGITVQRLLPGGRQMPDVLENRAIDSGSSRSRAITLEH